MTELQNETINTCVDYMSQLIIGIEKISEDLIGENNIAGNKLIGQLVEGLEWTNEALTLTKDCHDIEVNDIAGIMKELFAAIEENDVILVLDLLEYELKALIMKWREELLKLFLK